MEGQVPPEEGTPILVTLKASVHASFYSIDLVCKVRTSYRETHELPNTAPNYGTGGHSENSQPSEKSRSQPLEESMVTRS